MYKRILSIILAAIMIISLLPMSVLAEGDEPETEYTEPVAAAEPEETEEPIETPEPEETEEPDEPAEPEETQAAEPNGEETGIPIDEDHFPDPRLRDYANRNYDKDKNGYLSEDEIQKATYISTSTVKDLTGIEYFTNLQTAYIPFSPKDEPTVDFGSNTKLSTLQIRWDSYYDDDATGYYIDLSKNTKLVKAEIEGVLDVDLGVNTALKSLNLQMYEKTENPCTSVDLTGCTSLEKLSFSGSQITELDLSKNTALTDLSVSGSGHTKLDLSKNTALTDLTVSCSKLTELNLNGLAALRKVTINNTPLTSLKMDDCANLHYLTIEGSKLASLNIPAQARTISTNISVQRHFLTDHGDTVNLKELVGTENFSRIYNVNCDEYNAQTGVAAVRDNRAIRYDYRLDPDGKYSMSVEIIIDGEALAVDEAHFPDANLRTVVSNTFDTDKDGYISTQEMYSKSGLSLNNITVNDFTGLEYLQSVTSLSMSRCSFTDFAGVRMPRLSYISIWESEVSGKIDLSGCAELGEIRIHSCTAKQIILGKLDKLKRLYIELARNVNYLDLSGCPNIEYLSITYSGLLYLDMSMLEKRIKGYFTAEGDILTDNELPYYQLPDSFPKEFYDRITDVDGATFNKYTGTFHYTGERRDFSYKFDVYNDGSRYLEVSVRQNLTPAGAVRNVKWGLNGYVDVVDENTGETVSTYVELPGYITWTMEGVPTNRFRIWITYVTPDYSYNEYINYEVFAEPDENGVYTDFGLLLGDYPSGYYSARITPLGDGYRTTLGVEGSTSWYTYTRPEYALEPCTNARWSSDGNMLFTKPKDLTLAIGYQIILSYAEKSSDTPLPIYESSILYGEDLADGTTHDLGSIFEYNELPTGYYSFEVRTVSGIITLATGSAWCSSGKFHYVNDGYGTYETLLLLQNETDPNKIRSTVQALDKETLAELMLYDVYDEDTVFLLAELEEACGGLADVIVRDNLNVFGGNKPVVVGAALNTPTDPNKNISVIFARSSKSYAVSENLDPEKTVVMNISLGNTRSSTVSDVPIKLLIPMPNNIDYRYAEVYDCRGGTAGDFTGFIVYDENGASYISTVMQPLGDIMIGERAHHTCPQAKFTDSVPETHWAHDAIDYVLERGIMHGTGDNTFEPNGTVTRAMVVNMLYNLAGEPAHSTQNNFTDVPAGAWYADAVLWASENKIVSGKGDGIFDPNGNITREQLAIMMQNYAKYIGKDTSASEELDKFEDAGTVSSWATDAVKWACANKIVSGSSDGSGKLYLMPQGNATRAQIAVIFENFCKRFEI